MTEAVHDDHGHTVAAWTCVGVLILASLVMSLAVVFALVWLFAVGVVIAVLGVVAGKLLQLAGYGKLDPDLSPVGD
ncbi:MAG: HGxxPAAW family protein [Angustibacter sp.]